MFHNDCNFGQYTLENPQNYGYSLPVQYMENQQFTNYFEGNQENIVPAEYLHDQQEQQQVEQQVEQQYNVDQDDFDQSYLPTVVPEVILENELLRQNPVPEVTCKKKRFRSTFTVQQVQSLKEEFDKDMYLLRPRCAEIANLLQLKERQVKIWFQNQRMKLRKQMGGDCKQNFRSTWRSLRRQSSIGNGFCHLATNQKTKENIEESKENLPVSENKNLFNGQVLTPLNSSESSLSEYSLSEYWENYAMLTDLFEILEWRQPESNNIEYYESEDVIYQRQSSIQDIELFLHGIKTLRR